MQSEDYFDRHTDVSVEKQSEGRQAAWRSVRRNLGAVRP